VRRLGHGPSEAAREEAFAYITPRSRRRVTLRCTPMTPWHELFRPRSWVCLLRLAAPRPDDHGRHGPVGLLRRPRSHGRHRKCQRGVRCARRPCPLRQPSPAGPNSLPSWATEAADASSSQGALRTPPLPRPLPRPFPPYSGKLLAAQGDPAPACAFISVSPCRHLPHTGTHGLSMDDHDRP
jgi:hypothetical protein